ncbi:MAG TPA: hypothetical protein DCS63_10185 [Elusimicrobia bacterium]|nr:hypothetical protein [Elusimicrobiota bacterium]
MNPESWKFVAFVLIFIEANYLAYGSRFRGAVLAAFNTFFLLAFMENAVSLAFLACYSLLVYNLANLLRRPAAKKSLFPVLLFATLLFLVVKKYEVLSALRLGALLDHRICIIGFSYIFFKHLHLLIDSRDGLIREVTPLLFYNYTFGFYTLIAGPIQRYNSFAAEAVADRTAEIYDRRFLLTQLDRIVTGYLKFSVLAKILKMWAGPFTLAALPPGGALPLAKFVFAAYALYLFVYFNFSGYCDIVIGVANLSGVRLPENFAGPLAARNQLEFWSRWHITLSQWLNDYIFNPLCKLIFSTTPGLGILGAGMIGYFVTFFIAGMWHGNTYSFLVFGCLLGAGVAGVKLYEWLLKALLTKDQFRRYRANNIIRYAATVLSFNYTAFAFIFFENSPRTVLPVLKGILRGLL